VRTAIYTLSGVISEVTSRGRVPVEGVRVDVSSMPCDEHGSGCVGFGEGIGLFQTVMTDRNGLYSIPGVSLGIYQGIWAHTQGTSYTLRMLYVRCNGQMFYAGQEGLENRHETRTGSPSGMGAQHGAQQSAASVDGSSSNRADDPYGLTVVTD